MTIYLAVRAHAKTSSCIRNWWICIRYLTVEGGDERIHEQVTKYV